MSWSDAQIVATVAASALSGVVRVQQNGQWSNARTFTVPGASVTLLPNVINMVVGDTHSIQGLNSSGHSVTGLSWTSSDTSVVTLSTDDPPVLTAVGVGRATTTAGDASSDITVWSDTLPVGTVLWSNPGAPGDYPSIVPAVPSASGLADVFSVAYYDTGETVHAITSDGTTAWTADVTQGGSDYFPVIVPDFQGGLVVYRPAGLNWSGSITKLDGITGQAYPAYAAIAPSSVYFVGVHTDGTIFARQSNLYLDGRCDTCTSALPDTIIGIDPLSGTQKFSVALPSDTGCMGADPRGSTFSGYQYNGASIIAGDGYAYVPYACRESIAGENGLPGYETNHLMLMRVNNNGAYDNIHLMDWNSSIADLIPVGYLDMITNADTGTLLTWRTSTGDFTGPWQWSTAITNGTSVSLSGGIIAGQDVQPVLQAQDGSFVGTYNDSDTGQNNTIAFDASGNFRWVVPNEQPLIATADGGVIGQSGTTYDQNGNAAGQIANTPIEGWTGNAYLMPPLMQIAFQPSPRATPPFWSSVGANKSENSTSPLCHDLRDQLIAEYGKFRVLDASFPSPHPRFTPTCFDLTHSAASEYFTFSNINVPSPSLGSPEFNWALVKKPLVVATTSGYGLDYWRQLYGAPRILNSGYRDPVQNALAGGRPASRHQFGDAVDVRNQSGTSQEWQVMFDLALEAHADYREPQSLPCHLSCVHADWRFHDRGKYAH